MLNHNLPTPVIVANAFRLPAGVVCHYQDEIRVAMMADIPRWLRPRAIPVKYATSEVPVIYKGVHYDSLTDAVRATGKHINTIRKTVKEGLGK